MTTNKVPQKGSLDLPAESEWEVVSADGIFLPKESKWRIIFHVIRLEDEPVAYLEFIRLPLNTLSEVLYTIRCNLSSLDAQDTLLGVVTKVNNDLTSHLIFNTQVIIERNNMDILKIRLETPEEEYSLRSINDYN